MVNIISSFFQNKNNNPSSRALFVGGEYQTYGDLWVNATKLFAILNSSEKFRAAKYIGIMSYRTDLYFASIIAILSAGKAFVPFNPKIPKERNKRILELSGCKIVILGDDFTKSFPIDYFDNSIDIITQNDIDYFEQSKKTIPSMTALPVNPNDPVYLLFTSGTTGEPKGISISHDNLCSYVNHFLKLFPIRESDKCSQVFDSTFDLSMHDIFVTWSAGASLYVLSPFDLLSPINFINKNNLSVWFSVPSVISNLVRLNQLKPDSIKSIRLSLFCGEALTVESANKWQIAAPNSQIVNLYGPTETTISVSHYEINENCEKESLNGIVPIGKVFSTHNYLVINEECQPVASGDVGELCISGPQVCGGYLNNEEKTKSQFVEITGLTYYKTGDLVTENSPSVINIVGRKDFQTKIRGYRIELREIELCIEKFVKLEPVVVIPVPFNSLTAEYVIACVPHSIERNEQEIILHCKGMLPEYMVPKKVFLLQDFPTNINGKLDKVAIVKTLEDLL